MTNIPNIIFRVCEDKTSNTARHQVWIRSSQVKNPQYTHRLWDKKNCRAFVEQSFPWFLETFDAMPPADQLACGKYFFLFLYGGFALDEDVECLRSFDPLRVTKAGVVMARIGEEIGHGILAAQPRQEFWLLVISLMMRRLRADVLTEAHDLYEDYRNDTTQNQLAHIRVKLEDAQAASREKSLLGFLPTSSVYPLNPDDPIHEHFIHRGIIDQEKVLTTSETKRYFPHAYTVKYFTKLEPYESSN